MYYDATVIQELIVTLVSLGIFGGFTISATIFLTAYILRKLTMLMNNVGVKL